MTSQVQSEFQMELDSQTHQRIQALCADGDRLAESKKYRSAYDVYFQAFELLPSPKKDWESATWILAAIGDVSFLAEKYVTARETLEYALLCPNGLGNPFLHLRLGQVLFEQDNFDQAAEHLTRAYMGAGKQLFDEQDPKYFNFLKTKIDPPVTGEW
jgi:tetratricopeptide (TPR) repeat protein